MKEIHSTRDGGTSRRTFVASAAMAGFYIGAARVYGQDVKRDEQKLRVFKVGTGHMGAGDIDRLAMTGDVVFTGLCDVSPAAFPKAARDGKKLIPLDGGRTWSDMSETPIVGYPPHFLKTKAGRIVCSYVDRTTCREMAVVSDDQGRTWDVANKIFLSKGPTIDMGYPSTVENDDGTLLTVYYQSEKADEPPCLMATKWRLPK